MQSPHLKFRFADHNEVAGFSRNLKEQLGVTQPQLGDSWEWVIAEGPRTEAYLAPREVSSSLKRLLEIKMPYSLGLFAGGVEHGELRVSLELASRLASSLPRRKIILLSDEAEQPVLYGHDVLAGSIKQVNGGLRSKELVVLANTMGEILAIGQMLEDAAKIERAPSKRRVIRNLIDKGWYLRKGG